MRASATTSTRQKARQRAAVSARAIETYPDPTPSLGIPAGFDCSRFMRGKRNSVATPVVYEWRPLLPVPYADSDALEKSSGSINTWRTN